LGGVADTEPRQQRRDVQHERDQRYAQTDDRVAVARQAVPNAPPQACPLYLLLRCSHRSNGGALLDAPARKTLHRFVSISSPACRKEYIVSAPYRQKRRAPRLLGAKVL